MANKALHYFDKGMCDFCNVSGVEPEIIKKDYPIKKTLPRVITAFDLDKCSECGGTGRLLERY